MKPIFTILVCLFTIFVQAQEVKTNGKTYVVKGETIFENGKDITSALTAEEQTAIKAALVAQQEQEAMLKQKEKELEKKRKKEAQEAKKLEKEKKQAEKEKKKAEKARKKAEKEKKKAEKALKKKQKAKKKFEQTKSKFEKAKKKHKRMKENGNLSPNDEVKWQKKLEKLNKNVNKAQKRM